MATDDSEKYKIVLVLFQSNSLYNILLMNSLSEYYIHVRKKERGKWLNKRV